MQHLTSLSPLLSQYDAFLIDLWGVVHDGTALYPGALAAIEAICAENKEIIFLSNAPRRAFMTEETLERLGIPRRCYKQVMTSGEAAYQMLAENNSIGQRYYYLGPSKDENVLLGLDYEQATNPEEADFILNTGFEYDYQPEDEIKPLLKQLLVHKPPLLCINPDIEVVKQDGTRLLCAGWVADYYAKIGGAVEYIGKPYPLVYSQAMALLKCQDKNRILAIGDNLHTDILGANRMGIDSLLITGGILKSERREIPDAATLTQLAEDAGATPSYVAETLMTKNC